MTYFFKTLAFACALPLAIAAAPAFAEPQIGEPAPDFTAVDSNGKTHTLSELKGKTVVLEWTNHLCPYVGKHYNAGNMQNLQKEAAKDGIVWLSVISSAPGLQGNVSGEEANKLTAERDASPAAVLLDEKGDIGKMYSARTTPHMYVINAKGELIYKGAIDDQPSASPDSLQGAKNYLTNALQAVSAGNPVDPNSTRAYGCSVKYGS